MSPACHSAVIVNEGCWIGFDTKLLGHCVYWAADRTISIKHKVNGKTELAPHWRYQVGSIFFAESSVIHSNEQHQLKR
jgi:hypothetical protein